MCIRDRYQRRVHGEEVINFSSILLLHVDYKHLYLSKASICKLINDLRSSPHYIFLVVNCDIDVSSTQIKYLIEDSGFKLPLEKVTIVPFPNIHDADRKSNFQIAQNDILFGIRELLNKNVCLLYTSPSPRDRQKSRMPSSA
eukprot:TRINITY_DN19131_c0_g1_i1.p1 TRINITY_DN19131_c0_g1~~TRINITY_DN19131_c0_g1_i1.p1  ORF type:complete len:142 (-),score=12.45 TRINITY_DN19131_c0_g1_i1:10-435(-)